MTVVLVACSRRQWLAPTAALTALTAVAISLAPACSSKSAAPSAPAPAPGSSIPCDASRGAIESRGAFTRITVDATASGPAFVSIADVDGDGAKDLVVSKLGPVKVDGSLVTLSRGEVSVYYQGASPTCWHKVDIVGPSDAARTYFANLTTVADVDGDGDMDVVVPAGFFVCQFDKNVGPCGAIAWLENDGHGGFARHDVVPFGDKSFYHHAVLVDFDGDGTKDIVTVGETTSGAKARWFKGTRATPARFEPTPLDIGDGLGSFPIVADIDGDGDLDVASAEYFVKGSSFAWLERVSPPSVSAPAGVFNRHVIDDASGHGFMLELVPNLFGDGVTRALATNHTNTHDAEADADGGASSAIESSVFVFDLPSDRTERWTKRTISRGVVSRPSEGARVQGAPGVFGWGDIDGDGDIDVALAGDGDARTFWMEQTSPGEFAMHVIEEKLGQAAGALVEDLDGDGRAEMVFTGYEDGVVYVYRASR